MKGEMQIQTMIDGLNHDIETVKENHINGVINDEQQFAILSYKKAQVEILKYVLDETK